jgi:glucose-6-phosphate 1-dehydrogenase
MWQLWDRKSVSCVQITMAEDFGIEGRGAFYDSVGALRDVVQNHLLRVLALVAMDPPAGGSADDTQDKKARCSAPCRRPIRGTVCVANIGGMPTSVVWPGVLPPRHTWRCIRAGSSRGWP